MLLQHSSLRTLHALEVLLEQLTEREYTQPLQVLSASSIGKHVRHILEFYECLFQGLSTGVVDYDARQRDLRLETDKAFSLATIQALHHQIQTTTHDVSLQLQVHLEDSDSLIAIPTTLYRELVYNSEHCIHHLALIRIAVETSFPDTTLPSSFGVAYSTVRYQQSVRSDQQKTV
jgi:hypothetical protein